jgi:tetratricopeptide (TPR) repeat protein
LRAWQSRQTLEQRCIHLLACAPLTHHYKKKERFMRLKALLAGVALFHSSLTFAAWREASSEHFVIYAEESADDLRTFSEKLERYHKAMMLLIPSNAEAPPPSPSSRPTVYIVGNDRQVRELFGEGSKFVGGFYIPRAGNSVAFIPPVNARQWGQVSESETALMHEYAHHVMYEKMNFMVPAWFTEGFAEYFSSAKFEADGAVVLGGAPIYREYDFTQARKISIEELLDSATYASKKRPTVYDNFYARSWTLFHYLYSTQVGKEQMTDYLTRLNRGESQLDSARAAFGDLNELDKALDRYTRKSITSWRVFGEQLAFAPIAIRELNEAETAALPVRMRSERGVNPEQAAEVVVEARALAERYPDEPEVQAALAEAEYDAGNNDAAIAAADKALARNPNHINALIQKGYALNKTAATTHDPSIWAQSRSHFLGINKIEPENPIPLLYYYVSFTGQDLAPTQNAIDGLDWALQLAPYDPILRLTVAQGEIDRERYQDAIDTLSVIAYNPHDTSQKTAAVTLLEIAQKRLAEAGGSDATVAVP